MIVVGMGLYLFFLSMQQIQITQSTSEAGQKISTLEKELDSTITALQPGEISGIIRTRFGYHLVKRSGS